MDEQPLLHRIFGRRRQIVDVVAAVNVNKVQRALLASRQVFMVKEPWNFCVWNFFSLPWLSMQLKTSWICDILTFELLMLIQWIFQLFNSISWIPVFYKRLNRNVFRYYISISFGSSIWTGFNRHPTSKCRRTVQRRGPHPFTTDRRCSSLILVHNSFAESGRWTP